jgi:hypothetical protein
VAAGVARRRRRAVARGRRRAVAQLPLGDLVVDERDRPAGAVQLDAPRAPRIGGRRRLDRAEAAAHELEVRDDGVLHLDAAVEAVGRAGVDALDVAGQPEEHVDVVDRLVDEGPAAVERPGAAPCRAVVVLGRPPPLHGHAPQHQVTESSASHRGPHRRRMRLESSLVDDAEGDPGALAGVDHLVGAPQAHLDRLLDEHVLAPLGRRDRVVAAQSTWGAEDDGVDIFVLDESRWLLVVARPLLHRQCRGAPPAGHRDEPRALGPTQSGGVRPGDVPGTDDSESQHVRPFRSRRRRPRATLRGTSR